MTALDERIDARKKTLQSGLDERIAAREAQLSKTETPTPFMDAVGNTFMNTILQLPKLPGQALAAGAAAIEGGASAATGGEFDFGGRFEEQKGKFPASLLLKAPTTSVQELEAGFTAVRKEFGHQPFEEPGDPGIPRLRGAQTSAMFNRIGASFDEELARINQEDARIAEKFPFKTKAGEIGGDVLSLVGGRLPFAKGINAAETAFVTKKFTDSMTDPGVRKLVELALDSKAVLALKRGGARSVEAGAEAAVLSLLKEGDPLETAAFAAGGQIVGSGLLKFSEGLLTGGPLKIGGKILLASASFGALIQMSKETIPGGDANAARELIDSMSEGFAKVQMALILGAVSTLAGAGRLRGGDLAKSLPKFMDALATTPRAISISLLQDYLNATPDEQQTIDATLEQLQQDPEFFGPEITDRLLKALQAGNLTQALRE